MGWRLAEEVAWARPERPGPEWWTLLDLAQDARDETRRAMPGAGYLTARSKCTERTVRRRLKALRDAGLIKVVTHSAPGIRAVYEILVLHETPDSVRVLCITPNTGQNDAKHRTATVSATPDSYCVRPPVIPSSSPPSEIKHLTSPVPVEGARARSGQERFGDDENGERNRQLDALEAWMRDHPEATP